MRTKTLILGALPRPSEGPWIGIGEVRRWIYTPKVDFRNAVEIHVMEHDSPLSPLVFGLRGHPIDIQGWKARVVIRENVPGYVGLVTIELMEGKKS